MSKLQYIKGSKTRVLDTFPTKTFGNDGDIVISRISGKGVFLCSKAGGMWYAANKMQELNKLEKTSIRELTTNKLTVNRMINTEISADRFVVNDGGSIKYRTGEQVVGDLSLPFDNIAYKTAYCSFGQYSDKDTCESNGGTWYYSENDSHDSISSTAENQLLTVGQSIGGVDVEPTLTYDGSLLKITYDENNLDDNWRKNGYPRNIPQDEESMLTLERKNVSSSSNDAYMHFNVDSFGRSSINLHREDGAIYDGDILNILGDYSSNQYNGYISFIFGETSLQNDIVSNRKFMIRTLSGDIYLKTKGGQAFIQDGVSNSIFEFDAANTHMRITDDSDTGDYFDITVAAHGATTISTLDDDATAGHLTLDVDGNIELNADGGQVTIKDGSASHFLFDCDATSLIIYDDTDSADLFRIAVGASGATTITTVDDGAAIGHLTLVPDGDLVLDPVSQKTIINATDGLYFDGGNDTYIVEGSADRLDFYVGGTLMLQIQEAANNAVNVNSSLTIDAASKLFFDGGVLGHTYITESADDVLDFYVGTKKMLTIDEANNKILMGAANWVANIAAGSLTEFSAANSAYAGMILGYTDIGLNEAHAALSLTTSFVVPTDEFSVSFVAPPSGNVEIQCQIQHGFGSSGVGDLVAGLSTANATSGYSQLADFHEKTVNDVGPRGGITTIQISWTLTGLTAGTAYERWAGFKTPSITGTPFIQWGANSSARYPDFIMKATALPATITT